jgi:predicted dehydrogenase
MRKKARSLIQVGITGPGGMGVQRINLFSRMAGVKVSAVYARHIEKVSALCTRAHARAFNDYRQLLDITDAVVVCLPNHLHADFALQALNAGKHVLVEYPLCLSPAEAKILYKTACNNGKVLMAGNTIIHEAMFRYLMRYKHKLGSIQNAASRVALYKTGLSFNPELIGSIFAALHYHHIEYYHHLLGEVRAVMAFDESRPDPRRPGYKSLIGGTLNLEHESGAHSCIQWYLSGAGHGLPRGLWLNGTKSSVTVIELPSGRTQVVWDNRSVELLPRDRDEWGVEASSRDFIEAIRGNLDWQKRFRSDLKTLRTGWLAEQSARKHKILET